MILIIVILYKIEGKSKRYERMYTSSLSLFLFFFPTHLIKDRRKEEEKEREKKMCIWNQIICGLLPLHRPRRAAAARRGEWRLLREPEFSSVIWKEKGVSKIGHITYAPMHVCIAHTHKMAPNTQTCMCCTRMCTRIHTSNITLCLRACNNMRTHRIHTVHSQTLWKRTKLATHIYWSLYRAI